MGEIQYSVFPNTSASQVRRLKRDWNDLAEELRSAKQYPAKMACPMINLGVFGDQRSLNNSLRWEGNLLQCTGVECDYDDEIVTVEEAAQLLASAGVECVVYTSASHTPTTPHWRVLAPLSSTCLPAERAIHVARINGALGGILAQESFRLAQSYFIGRVAGAVYQVQQVRGTCVDLLSALDAQAIGPQASGTRHQKSREQVKNEAYANDPVCLTLHARGWIKSERTDGGLNILCPFDYQHTQPSSETSTTYWPPLTGGYAFGNWKCQHAHCEGRSRYEFESELLGEEEPRADTGIDWPVLAQEALHGTAGEIVRALDPLTESDRAAILLTALTLFGATIGRTAYVEVENTRHHGNLFLVLSGETAKARKGTSFRRVENLFRQVPDFCRVVSGLSSGEGLLFAIRDGTAKRGKRDEDPGVDDKRILIVEAEWAQVMRVAARPGNTLSTCVREAWDSGYLSTLTKSDPITVTDGHVAILGHITIVELRAELTQTSAASGFANRHCFAVVKRSKLLPHGGGRLAPEVETRLVNRLSGAVATAKAHRNVVGMTAAARQMWEAAYPKLSQGYPGLLGAVTNRSEAITLRLSLLYVLLDGEVEIGAEHLRAGLAAWEYCERSARLIFGSAVGDRIADEALRALRAAGNEGMTRTQIRDLFGRHESTERIGAALQMLQDLRRAIVVRKVTGGRPVETWIATESH